MSTVALVPAYNEAARLAPTVAALLDGVAERVLVVDDGSSDDTAGVAARAGAEVIRLSRNRGKGAAVTAGLSQIVGDEAARWILLADADLGDSARVLDRLLEPVRSGRADLAIASFETAGGFGLVKRAAARGVQCLTGFRPRSPLSGQRALAREAVQRLLPLSGGWGLEVGMTVRALWAGLRVLEVELPLRHRETGRSLAGFLHRGRQGAGILATLCRLAVTRAFSRGAGK